MQKLFDSEMKIMEILWEQGRISAKQVSLLAAERIGWNKNTTYTVLKKLEAKGFLIREDPGFLCTPVCNRDQVCRAETQTLVDRLFGGSKKALFSTLLADETLTEQDIQELRRMIEER